MHFFCSQISISLDPDGYVKYNKDIDKLMSITNTIIILRSIMGVAAD